MKVERMIKSDVDTFQVGDIINFTLSNGEQVQAMAMKQEQDGMIFLLVDCLRDEYRMNAENSNRGGYDASDLKESMDGEILARFPADLRENDSLCQWFSAAASHGKGNLWEKRVRNEGT